MHAVIHHFINDPAKWEQTSRDVKSQIEQHRLPKGLTPLQYFPSVDGRRADCLWEAESLEALRQYMDRTTSGASRNEYFEVKAQDAFGLPKGEERVLARAA